jgi:NAD(P)-dependent dehydrogenase (short-subunit alcohol dehydrogenase family)
MDMDLNKSVVLVTGASGGIGAAISRDLAKANATVAVHYNSSEKNAKKLVNEIGHGSKCFQADLTDPKQAMKLFDDVMKEYGKVDVLVNNAGLFRTSPIEISEEEWLEDWNTTLALNLTSVGVLCQAAINHFKKNAGGRIINIASRAAFRGETRDHLAYAASKGGMVSLSRSIARSFGKDSIKSFVIAPGFVRTKMAEEHLKKHENEMIANEIALDRITEPEDIAPLVVLLASGKMDHATGTSIDINAGSYMR